MKHQKRKKNLIKTLSISDFNTIFSSKEKLDTYTTELMASVKSTSADVIKQTKSTQNALRKFPKQKASIPFTLSSLFPPINVVITPTPIPSVVSEKKPSLLNKLGTRIKQTILPLKKGTVLTYSDEKITEKPIKHNQPKTPPISKKPIKLPSETPPLKRPQTKPASIPKLKTPIQEEKTTPTPDPVKTVSSEAMEKRLQDRQKKVQDLFDQKGSVS